jgi:hypothetical protein
MESCQPIETLKDKKKIRCTPFFSLLLVFLLDKETSVFDSGEMECFVGQGVYWVPFNLAIAHQWFKYRVIKSLCAPDNYSTKSMQKYFKQFQSLWRYPLQNTFWNWTVLYWTRSSRTQFGVSINVWRLAGDTLNITCSFLYWNNQVHRDVLITLYNLKVFWGLFMWVVVLA